jgi:DNA-binding GntR family transcriptional regulator
MTSQLSSGRLKGSTVAASGRVKAALGEGLPRRIGAAEMIADALRDRILDGHLRPGDSLREVEVAETFGVARNTAREALKVLTLTGLTVHEVHHGVSVRRLRPEDVDALYGLRTILEGAACDRAGTLSDIELAALKASVEKHQEAIERGDVCAVAAANRDFHRAIVDLLHNARVTAVHAEVMHELSLVLVLEERDPHMTARWLERDRELVRLFQEGSPEACRAAVESYLDDSRHNLKRWVIE